MWAVWKRGYNILKGTISTEKQELHHGMDFVGKNVHVILGSNVSFQSYHGAHRNPDMAAKTTTESPPCFPLGIKLSVKLDGFIQTYSRPEEGHNVEQYSSDHIIVFHCSIVSVLWLKNHFFLLRALSSLMNVFLIAAQPELSCFWSYLLTILVLTGCVSSHLFQQ